MQDYQRTIYRRIYSMYSGGVIAYDKINKSAGPSLSYGYVSAGYYYDTGIFGAASPILGQTIGLGVSPAVGNINFTTVSADFRKYLMPLKPFTLAFRALHIGRYGKDGEDPRFYPFFIGYWDLVRGYESFSQAELAQYELTGEGFDYSRLYGSRMIVANVEFRFPLLGVLGVGKGYYGAWPLEFFGFFDWGRNGECPRPVQNSF